jgi:hypothetical protein
MQKGLQVARNGERVPRVAHLVMLDGYGRRRGVKAKSVGDRLRDSRCVKGGGRSLDGAGHLLAPF